MKRKSHKKITKKLFPNVDPEVIDRINKLLDGPSNGYEPNPKFGRIPGLNYRGHRRWRHNAIGAIIAGYESDGIDGAIAAAAHVGVDLTRDQLIEAIGVDGADIIESALNIIFRLLEKKREKPKKYPRINDVQPGLPASYGIVTIACLTYLPVPTSRTLLRCE
jgi:hypothetical protein